jgi:hypothetical protein
VNGPISDFLSLWERIEMRAQCGMILSRFEQPSSLPSPKGEGTRSFQRDLKFLSY